MSTYRASDYPITDEAYPNVHFYVSNESGVSMSVHRCWVSALFESAAKSWANHDVEAEVAYRKLNAEFDAKGVPRELLLGLRKESP